MRHLIKFLLLASFVALICYGIAKRVQQVQQEWDAQPESVKAAAAEMEQRLLAAEPMNFVQYKDGRIAVVKIVHGSIKSIVLKECGHPQSYQIDIPRLTHDRVTLIPRSSPIYAATAINCVNRAE